MPAPRRPKTPIESLLNESQRSNLLQYLKSRVIAAESSLIEYRRRRELYEKQMHDNFEWRTGGRTLDYFRSSVFSDQLAQTIFDKQNDSLNIVGGFAAFIVARAVDDFFGTDPYFSISPEGVEDMDLASDLQRHSEWKLRQSPWKDAALDGIDWAIGIGEGVIKQTWRREVDEFETRRSVLMDASTGAEVKGPDDDYIYGPDEYGNDGDDISFISMQDPATGIPSVMMAVAKYPGDPETGDPGLVLNVQNLTFEEREIPKVNVRFNNVQANTVHFKDIIVSVNEPNLEDASFVGQRTQMLLSDIIAQYGIDEDTIAMFETDTHDAKTEAAKPDAQNLGEISSDDYPDEEFRNPMIELIECWIRHDPVGDRKQRRMYVLYAPKHDVIVEMDYIANKTPEGKLPFQVVRAFKVKNRWYGRGYFEIYEKAQEFIDRHLNYVAHRNRFHANPITFFDPSNLLDGEDIEEFSLEPGRTYRLKPGLKAADVFQILEMPDLDERTWQLMQMMIQVVQVRSGITSAAQGEVSSLPSTSTATGIESILQSASTLARQPMNLMKSGLEQSLLYAIKLIYANMDRDEIFTYFNGDAQKVGTLQKVTVQNLEMNVRLLLTRFKAREATEAVTKAIPLVQAWLMVPEPEKAAVRPVFVQGFKGLGFDQAESIVRQAAQIDPVTGQMMMNGQPMLPPAAPGQPPAPGGHQLQLRNAA